MLKGSSQRATCSEANRSSSGRSPTAEVAREASTPTSWAARRCPLLWSDPENGDDSHENTKTRKRSVLFRDFELSWPSVRNGDVAVRRRKRARRTVRGLGARPRWRRG